MCFKNLPLYVVNNQIEPLGWATWNLNVFLHYRNVLVLRSRAGWAKTEVILCMLEELKQEIERSTIMELQQISYNKFVWMIRKLLRGFGLGRQLSRKKTLVYGYFLKSIDFKLGSDLKISVTYPSKKQTEVTYLLTQEKNWEKDV